jgi:hypothetical protein
MCVLVRTSLQLCQKKKKNSITAEHISYTSKDEALLTRIHLLFSRKTTHLQQAPIHTDSTLQRTFFTP